MNKIIKYFFDPWCCPAFRSVATAGKEKRGICVFTKIPELPEHMKGEYKMGRSFVLQFRSVEERDESDLDTDFLLTLAAYPHIFHCPFCGRELKKKYKRGYPKS